MRNKWLSTLLILFYIFPICTGNIYKVPIFIIMLLNLFEFHWYSFVYFVGLLILIVFNFIKNKFLLLISLIMYCISAFYIMLGQPHFDTLFAIMNFLFVSLSLYLFFSKSNASRSPRDLR